MRCAKKEKKTNAEGVAKMYKVESRKGNEDELENLGETEKLCRPQLGR